VALGRRLRPDGAVAHAMLTVGPAMLMIEAEWPTLPSRAPPKTARLPWSFTSTWRTSTRWSSGPSAPVRRCALTRPVLGGPHRVDHGPGRARLDRCVSRREDDADRARGEMVEHPGKRGHHREERRPTAARCLCGGSTAVMRSGRPAAMATPDAVREPDSRPTEQIGRPAG
jgi:hypothetical protein